MEKLRKALSGQDNRDNDSSTGILPVSYNYIFNLSQSVLIVLYYLFNNLNITGIVWFTKLNCYLCLKLNSVFSNNSYYISRQFIVCLVKTKQIFF